MFGEILALLSAVCFAFTGVAIAKGAPTARGDNGALLSIVLTAILAAIIWFLTGGRVSEHQSAHSGVAVAWFALAGLLSNVAGRTTMFRSIALVGAITGSFFRRLTPLFGALLAFLVLGETLTVLEGMGLILMVLSMAAVMARDFGTLRSSIARSDRDARLGQLYGIGSAACYGSGYVVRKLGLAQEPDPALGAFIGAVAGLCWYAATFPLSRNTRAAVTGLAATTGKWQLTAAGAMSAGQVSLFFALQHADVASVAIIGSLDIFIGIWLAVFVLRSEPMPDKKFILATCFATLGVIVVALSG